MNRNAVELGWGANRQMIAEKLLAPRTMAESIGHTPLLRLCRVAESVSPEVEIWAKAEFLNPSGSVKDRAAWGIVQAAFRSGLLSDHRILLDASSGNTAVSFAMLGASFGFPVILFLPRNANADRVARIRAYGGEIEFTDPGEGTDGAQRAARARYESDPDRYYYGDQYNNPANPFAHYSTTGPEIWSQTRGRATHFVAGVGTGGTLTGTTRYLKERNPRLKSIGVEPDNPLHGIEGLKHIPSALRPTTYDASVVDATLRIQTESAQRMTARLARDEGLMVGTSSGAAVLASLEVAETLRRGVVVTVLPDRGDPRGEGVQP